MLDPFTQDVYVPSEDGTFVSENHARIAEIINDYDPACRLAWIPPSDRQPGDKPFAVIETREGRDYVAFYADQCDERILARLFENDNTRGNVQRKMEAHNAAVKAIELKKAEDEMLDAHERARAILKSPKSTYTMRDERTGELRKYT